MTQQEFFIFIGGGVLSLLGVLTHAYFKKRGDIWAREDSLDTEKLIQQAVTKTVEVAKIDVIQDNIQTIIEQQRAQKAAIEEITHKFWEKQQWHQKKQAKLEEMLEFTVEFLEDFKFNAPESIELVTENYAYQRAVYVKMLSTQQMYLPEIEPIFIEVATKLREMNDSVLLYRKALSTNAAEVIPKGTKTGLQLQGHSLGYSAAVSELKRLLPKLCEAICAESKRMNPESYHGEGTEAA